MRYKIGDAVRVLPYEEIAAKFVSSAYQLPSGCHFPHAMNCFCGETMTVVRLTQNNSRYILDGAQGWVFTDEMLEDDIIDAQCKFSFQDLLQGVEDEDF